jgi:hypothetical protein
MEEIIKRLLKRFEIIKHLADLSPSEKYHYFFNDEVCVYNYTDETKEIKYKDVMLDRDIISFPADMTASKLEYICIDLEKLIEQWITPELRGIITEFNTVKSERKAIEKRMAELRKNR